MRIICLFNLKPGVSVAEYEAWARATDIPTVNALGSVEGFTVHRASGILGDPAATPPYAYVEIIEIAGMDAFMAEVATERMQAVAAQFQGFADNPQFIVTEDL
ncbi:hypothetical protein MACH24_09430 [Erythrobacter sp. Dej080120_24]|uniref:REDY-like protein HapK n=1 Tax=Erythrobacter sp. Dej080120_24 TaxID=3024837 RepID=UPI00291E3F76|nr:hypothetical protein MACH24_09430 [Erythrobacter sp. Dej080120_24]